VKFLRATPGDFRYSPGMVKVKPSRTLVTLRDTRLPKLPKLPSRDMQLSIMCNLAEILS
jgi:hypothetical protein